LLSDILLVLSRLQPS